MPDAWRAYLEMALGLTETPRKRAQRAVGDLVNRGGATAAQLQGLVEDLLQAGMANREALTNIVRFEVDKALGVVGLATAEEVTELTTRVRELEKQLKDAQDKPVPDDGTTDELGGTRVERPAPLPKKVAKKTVAKKAVPATPNAMPTAGTTPGVAKKTVAKKAVKKVAPAPAPEPQPEPLSESIAEALPPAEAAALAALAESPAAEPAPVKKAAAKKAPGKKTAAAKKAAPVKKTAPVKNAAPSTEPEI